MLRRCVILLSVLSLAGCSGVGPTANVASSTSSDDPTPPSSNPPTTTAPPSTPPPTTSTPPPVVTPPPSDPPPVSTPPVVSPPPVTTEPPPSTTPQNIVAWGNSQTSGYGLSDPSTQAWPVVMAAARGWTVDNQAASGSLCSDLTTEGAYESLWDLKINSDSVDIYAQFHNEQAQYGPLPYHIAYARNCIEAQTAWLAIPENGKIRAINAVQGGGNWVAGPNSSSALTTTAGENLTFSVTGKTVYLATARVTNTTTAIYTVNVDGNLLVDPDTGSTQFNQMNDAGSTMANFIRVGGTQNTTHTIVYTCIDPGGSGCLVFYAAGVGGGQIPLVYSLSPVPNASWNTQYNFDPATSALYRNAWLALVTELQSDGLNIIPVDAGNTAVYNPDTESQDDGVHENAAGHASIGNYAATLQ